jgi:hypothetical protein
MAWKSRKPVRKSKKGKTKRLAKAAVGLAATALIEAVAQRAAQDPRFREKVMAIARAAGRKARTAGKKIARAGRSVGKRKVIPNR